MGEAMVRGALAAGIVGPDSIRVADRSPARRERLQAAHGVRISGSNRNVLAGASIVVLAVKPQSMPDVMSDLRGALASDQVVLSVAAGVTLETLTQGLGHRRVVRAIPNTPAQVGAGISVWVATDETDGPARQHVSDLLGALGRVVEVDDERYLDMATAVSGSGPGFVFLFMEAMIDASVRVGLPRGLAQQLAIETIRGSGEMARVTELHPALLRNMVTSPGGTTAAGLAALEEGGLRSAVDRAIDAAYERSQVLGRGARREEGR